MNINGYIEQFQWALKDEIEAIRKNGGQKTYLSDGRILGEKNGIYLYSFNADSELRFPDDTPVDVELKGKKYPGWIISIEGFDLILGLEDFIGGIIPMAILYTAPWFLLEELKKRLSELDGSDISRKNLPGMMLERQSDELPFQDDLTDDLIEKIYRRIGKYPQYNSHQLDAVTKVLSGPISYIWGPPGTGKTSTLGLVATTLLENSNTILILAHSNIAVDVAMISLMKYAYNSPAYQNGEIVRYGVIHNPDVENYPLLSVREAIRLSAPMLYSKLETLETRRKDLVRKSRREGLGESDQNRIKEELLEIKTKLALLNSEVREKEKEVLKKARIVGCTLSKATIAPEIYERRFDAVLIDEASMAYIPHCVFTSSLATQRTAIFGDFRQLAPISQADTQHSNHWLKRDIFDEAGIIERVNRQETDHRLVLLRTQYRMHSSIAKIPNTLFYQNRLVDGVGVDQQAAAIISRNPAEGKAVVFYDLSHLNAHCFSEQESHSRFNFMSALLTVELAQSINQQGIQSVGIITPYSAQARLIHRLLLDLKCDPEKMKVATVHKFQGSEKDVILFDTAEGYPKEPGLLISKDNDTAHRLSNVAVSRARGKFILLSNQQYIRAKLQNDNGLRKIVEYLSKNLGAERPVLANTAGNRIAFTEMPGIQYYPSSGLVKGAVEKDLSSAREEIAINWPDPVQKPYFSPYSMLVCDSSKVRFFFTGAGKSAFNVGLRNARFWEGVMSPNIGLVGIDRKILWVFPSTADTNGIVIRLELPKTISLLYGFWRIVPENDLIQGTISEKIESGKGPIGLPCPQCKGLMWLEIGRYGVYLGCTSHCGFTRKLMPNDATELARVMGKTCERCGGQVIGKRSYGGVFLACCNYPECKWTMPIENLV